MVSWCVSLVVTYYSSLVIYEQEFVCPWRPPLLAPQPVCGNEGTGEVREKCQATIPVHACLMQTLSFLCYPNCFVRARSARHVSNYSPTGRLSRLPPTCDSWSRWSSTHSSLNDSLDLHSDSCCAESMLHYCKWYITPYHIFDLSHIITDFCKVTIANTQAIW